MFLVCDNCNKQFQRSYHGDGDHVYCSRSCGTIARNKTRRGYSHPSYTTGAGYYRRRALELYGNICNVCGISEWLNKPIIMDVDHIDGDRTNNLDGNLRVICPNCHRQTETWGPNKISKK